MPSYEFKCNDCNHTFSLSMTVAEYEMRNAVCTKCGSGNIKQKISSFSVITSKKS